MPKKTITINTMTAGNYAIASPFVNIAPAKLLRETSDRIVTYL